MEGAPIGLLWWYLPAELSDRGVPVDEVTGITAMLVLPWALKFLWAPLLDLVQGRRLGLRGWLVCAQIGMLGTLLPLPWIGSGTGLDGLAWLLVAHAVFGATQDVAIDAWAIGSSEPAERGSLNAWMQAGMLIGRVAFSGVALWLGVSLTGVVIALAAILGASVLLVACAPGVPSAGPDAPAVARARGFRAALAAVAKSPLVLAAAVVALIGGGGFEAAGALAAPYLVELGRDRAGVGAFWTIAALAAIPGGLLAGRIADRVGHARTAGWALLALTATIGGVALLAAARVGATWNETLLVAAFFCLGAFNAASYALFMDLSPSSARATTFSTLMSLTNLCESWAARLGGALAARTGFAAGFAVPAMISLFALIPLALITPRPRDGY